MADPVRRAGVLGRPIAHSMSPLLHRAAYAELGLNWQYEVIDCGVAELPAVLAGRAGWAGFSCTMPLKRAVLDVAAEVHPRAWTVGAGNTLLPREDGGWLADNTDVPGICAALAERGVRPASATVLGAGGTAQAALAALASLGVPRCAVLVRDLARTDEVRRTGARAGIAVEVGLLREDAAGLAADLVVSTLPPGAADPLAACGWRPGQAVLDVVYAPWPTRLAVRASEAGSTVVNGALMLLHQAAAQIELMTGRPAPVPAMRAALEAALRG